MLEDFGAAWQQADDAFQGAQLFHGAELVEKIFQGELAFAHLFFELAGVGLVHRFGGAFDQAHDVAHAQDS